MSWLSRLTNVFQSSRLDRDLEAELEFHIEARTDELIAKGLPPEDAAREARRHFGNRLLLRETSREVKLISWLESVFQDVRFGLRMLLKNRAVTAAAVLSLSLAIGACTGAFSLIDALILRPLPVPDPGRLVFCSYPTFGPSLIENTYTNAALFDRFERSSDGKVELFGISYPGPLQPITLDDSGGEGENVRSQRISGDGFRILGIQPAIGRVLTASDDGRSVAVLNYSFWARRFGSSPAVLGHWFEFHGKQFQIVGVARRGFDGLIPGYRMDLWFPNINATASQDPSSDWDQVWGRLKPGVRSEQARQALQVAFTNYRRDHTDEFIRAGGPPDQLPKYKNAQLVLSEGASGSDSMIRMDFERPLWILAAVVALVLLIACSNIANLLVARAAAREREMALRISIGAGRARLVQQLLIESVLMSGVACILGLAIAAATAPSIVNLLSPSDFPAYLDLQIGWRMLGFVAFIGIATTLLFGLAPALRGSAVSPHEALKTGGAKQSSKIGLLRALLASQVGFSFVVLFLGGLLLLSFQKLTSVDLGFSKDRVVLLDIRMQNQARNDQTYLVALQLLDRVRQIPTVQAAGMSLQGLMGGDYAWVMRPGIRFPGHQLESVKPRYLPVSTGFLETMQIRLADGRDLTARDMAPGSTAVVVNQAFVRQYLPGENPLGVRFEKFDDDPRPAAQEIVGVVQDAKYNNLREATAPTVYGPWGQPDGVMEVRTAGNPMAVAPRIRQAINDSSAGLHVNSVTLQSTRINNTLLRERLLALLAGFFAIVAVVLAAIGLYGVLSYSVVRRTKEIGIRVALGARQLGVVRLVVSDVMLVIAIGLGIGIAGGFVLGRFVASLLFEVKPSDFWSLALPLACFLAASALAALPPAFRAAHVDPIVALREE
ncbi:MAG TPA: ABC transporter permease [Bryobacteraceae bacterium]|jgi:predicted permease|nr:ABC transporter permease [Bryobacteraceae bacterium]